MFLHILKGIVSRDFGCLQMMYRGAWVPDVLLEVYFFLPIIFKVLSLQRVKLLLMHLAKAQWQAGDVSFSPGQITHPGSDLKLLRRS